MMSLTDPILTEIAIIINNELGNTLFRNGQIFGSFEALGNLSSWIFSIITNTTSADRNAAARLRYSNA